MPAIYFAACPKIGWNKRWIDKYMINQILMKKSR